jgi:hypothetical protein
VDRFNRKDSVPNRVHGGFKEMEQTVNFLEAEILKLTKQNWFESKEIREAVKENEKTKILLMESIAEYEYLNKDK